MTVGVVPDARRPGIRLHPAGRGARATGARRVARFVEKPDRARAEQMRRDGYLWNSGIFVWRVGDFLDDVRRAHAGGRAALHANCRRHARILRRGDARSRWTSACSSGATASSCFPAISVGTTSARGARCGASRRTDARGNAAQRTRLRRGRARQRRSRAGRDGRPVRRVESRRRSSRTDSCWSRRSIGRADLKTLVDALPRGVRERGRDERTSILYDDARARALRAVRVDAPDLGARRRHRADPRALAGWRCSASEGAVFLAGDRHADFDERTRRVPAERRHPRRLDRRQCALRAGGCRRTLSEIARRFGAVHACGAAATDSPAFASARADRRPPRSTTARCRSTSSPPARGAIAEIKGWWLDDVWDFIRLLPEQLADDIRDSRERAARCQATDAAARTRRSSATSGSSVGGGRRSIEPYVVFDATALARSCIGDGSHIRAFSRITGPCYLGREVDGPRRRHHRVLDRRREQGARRAEHHDHRRPLEQGTRRASSATHTSAAG